MNTFLQLKSSGEFTRLLQDHLALESVFLPISEAGQRVLAADLFSPEDLPPFNRSSMDGFAVRAKDTFGLTESEPFPFAVTGEIRMGQAMTAPSLAPGEAIRIWTGGELPPGADAVAMEEYSRQVDASFIEVFRPVAPGENVVRRGEDIRAGSRIFSTGRRLTAQDTGLLAGLGLHQVEVVRKPRVALISSGDELVSCDERHLLSGKIRDINTTTLSNMLRTLQCEPVPMGLVPDDFDDLRERCRAALDLHADMVILSGGSSIGSRDLTGKVFASLDGARILAHGVEIRPGKPTILGKIGNVPLVGLPGHIASALVVFQVFIRMALAALSGVADPAYDFLRTQPVRVSRNIPSVTGREDYVRVKITSPLPRDTSGLLHEYLPLATPVFGKSGTLSSLIHSDGLLKIARDMEGVPQGHVMEVMYIA